MGGCGEMGGVYDVVVAVYSVRTCCLLYDADILRSVIEHRVRARVRVRTRASTRARFRVWGRELLSPGLLNTGFPGLQLLTVLYDE